MTDTASTLLERVVCARVARRCPSVSCFVEPYQGGVIVRLARGIGKDGQHGSEIVSPQKLLRMRSEPGEVLEEVTGNVDYLCDEIVRASIPDLVAP